MEYFVAPAEALQNRLHRAAVMDAYRKLLRVAAPNLLARNRVLHRMLADGVNVEYTRADGSIAGAQARVIDFELPEQNDFLAVNQLLVGEIRTPSQRQEKATQTVLEQAALLS